MWSRPGRLIAPFVASMPLIAAFSTMPATTCTYTWNPTNTTLTCNPTTDLAPSATMSPPTHRPEEPP